MARFKRKKRVYRKPSYTDKCIMATKGMLTDSKLGYEVPTETYNHIASGK